MLKRGMVERGMVERGTPKRETLRRVGVAAQACAVALAIAGCQQEAGPASSTAGGSLRQRSYQPAPPPPPRHLSSPNEKRSYAGGYASGYAGGGYSGSSGYRAPYQNYAPNPASSVPRAWVPSGPRRDWNYIVLHHSDTDKGSAASFRQYHVRQRHWNDLGYHFVIGNGNGAGNGAVEVGGRWTRQETGAHAGVLKFNEEGIGICLVGNFDEDRPTAAQMQSVAKLTAYLMRTYKIPPSRVIGHNQAKEGKTDCPGKHFSMATLRTMAARYALADDPTFPAFEHLAAGELLRDVSPQ